MPDRNGLHICRNLKSRPATADIPVIIVTGDASLNNMVSGYLAGARRFLSKPFELGELGEYVQKIFNRHDTGENIYDDTFSQSLLEGNA